MPFRSAKQQRFMFANHPEIANRWVREAKASGSPIVQPDAATKRLAEALRNHPKKRRNPS